MTDVGPGTDGPVADGLMTEGAGPLQDFARTVAFMHDFARRKAGRTVEVPGGFAVLNERYPGSYDDNKLIVWSDTDPGAVLEAADQVLAGRAHRLVNVDDDRLGQAYAPAFEAAGYTHEINLVMVFSGTFPHDAEPVDHLDLPALLPTLRAGWRETLPEAADALVRHQVVWCDLLRVVRPGSCGSWRVVRPRARVRAVTPR
jgi:hypothetical protein